MLERGGAGGAGSEDHLAWGGRVGRGARCFDWVVAWAAGKRYLRYLRYLRYSNFTAIVL